MDNPPSSTCIATLPEFPSVLESLQFQFTGLIVVFVALGSIWGLLETTGWIFRRLTPLQSGTPAVQPAPAPSAAATTPGQAVPAEVPPEILAVIAAAVHVMTDGQPHRIITVTPHDPSFDWAREGRRAIFASHKTH